MKAEWISEYHTGAARQPAHPPPLDVLNEKTETYSWTDSGTKPLEWLPATTSAISLRMLALDTSIVYKAGHYMARDKCTAYNVLSRFDDLSCLIQWENPVKTKKPMKVVKREASERAAAKKEKEEKLADSTAILEKEEKANKSIADNGHERGTPNGKRVPPKIAFDEDDSDVEEEIIEYEEDIGAQDDGEYDAEDDEEDDDDFVIEREIKRTPRKITVKHGASSFDDHDDGFD